MMSEFDTYRSGFRRRYWFLSIRPAFSVTGNQSSEHVGTVCPGAFGTSAGGFQPYKARMVLSKLLKNRLFRPLLLVCIVSENEVSSETIVSAVRDLSSGYRKSDHGQTEQGQELDQYVSRDGTRDMHLAGGSQLIFTTHESLLMDFQLLRRDEIWFAEKDDEGRSRLYSLEDFNERNDRRIEKAYREGRYGAVPIVSDSPIERPDRALSHRGGSIRTPPSVSHPVFCRHIWRFC